MGANATKATPAPTGFLRVLSRAGADAVFAAGLSTTARTLHIVSAASITPLEFSEPVVDVCLIPQTPMRPARLAILLATGDLDLRSLPEAALAPLPLPAISDGRHWDSNDER